MSTVRCLIMRRILKAGLLAIVGCCVASVAHATTVDTFVFQQADFRSPVPPNLFAPLELIGSFSGTVEGNGYLDLQSFAMSTTLSGDIPLASFTLADLNLTLFSFNVGDYISTGSTSSLDLVGSTMASPIINGFPAGEYIACVGAAAAFAPSPCPTLNVQGSVRGSIFAPPLADSFIGVSTLYSPSAPTITLVSSTTTGGGGTTVPEPSSASLIIVGLVALVVRRRHSADLRI